MAENHDGGERAPKTDGGETGEAPAAGEAGAEARLAAEALGRLRVVIDQAAQAIGEFGTMSEEWAGLAARDLRQQGERAVGTVSRQVEANPLASLAVAFAIGYLCGVLTRR